VTIGELYILFVEEDVIIIVVELVRTGPILVVVRVAVIVVQLICFGSRV
jgi:hypothetical protein